MSTDKEFQKGYQAYLEGVAFSAYEDMKWIDGYLQGLYDATDHFLEDMDEEL